MERPRKPVDRYGNMTYEECEKIAIERFDRERQKKEKQVLTQRLERLTNQRRVCRCSDLVCDIRSGKGVEAWNGLRLRVTIPPEGGFGLKRMACLECLVWFFGKEIEKDRLKKAVG